MANIDGTDDSDLIIGTGDDDLINGLGADDSLKGLAGNDILNGDDGNDELNGGEGNDVLDGGAGNNRASFFDSTGTVTGGATVSLLLQGHAQDTGHGLDTLINIQNLSGTGYNDVLTGDNHDNWLWGQNAGPDGSTLLANDDTLDGRGGNDLLMTGSGNNILKGGAGTDTATFDYTLGGIEVSLKHQDHTQDTGQGSMFLSGFENLFGSEFSDRLHGDNGDNVLGGNGGDDVLIGGKGGDTLYGDGYAAIPGVGYSGAFVLSPSGALDRDTGLPDSGNDVLKGGAGDDVLAGGGGADTLTGGKGDDSFVFLDTSDSAPGTMDLIKDLHNTDLIDLSSIDANTNVDGDQAFTLVSALSGTAGQAALTYSSHTTYLSLDVNGDGVADMIVDIRGHHTDFDNFAL